MQKRVVMISVVIIIAFVVSLYLFNLRDGVINQEKNVDMLVVEPIYSIVIEDITYYDDIEGYLAQPEESGNYPGIVMIHEWWGLNDNIKQMADNLAMQGYVVLAVDLYNGQIATDSSKAGELAGAVRNNPEEAIKNMRAAILYLDETHKTNKIASLGWCFGGHQSLQISLNEDVDASVIYYGSLITDKEQLSA